MEIHVASPKSTTISSLIKSLEVLRDSHGDLPVTTDLTLEVSLVVVNRRNREYETVQSLLIR